MKQCKHCAIAFAPKRNEQIYCSHSCAAHYKGINKRGTTLPGRQGWEYSKRTTDKNGYIRMYAAKHPHANGRKMIQEHIMVMELHLNRPLTATECVHHINKDKLDNRLENLQLMTKAQHSKLHAQETVKTRQRIGGRFA